jgi:hypothetical protein
MCWASNHQNNYRNGPRAHFPFKSPSAVRPRVAPSDEAESPSVVSPHAVPLGEAENLLTIWAYALGASCMPSARCALDALCLSSARLAGQPSLVLSMPLATTVRLPMMQAPCHVAFTWSILFGVLFICYSLSVFNEWLFRVDNEQSMFPKGVAGEVPEQQLGEGKCPLSHYVLLSL